ncbi:MAG TPA: hypothetical protein VIG44_09125 [Thermomicrobiales bacterium]
MPDYMISSSRAARRAVGRSGPINPLDNRAAAGSIARTLPALRIP